MKLPTMPRTVRLILNLPEPEPAPAPAAAEPATGEETAAPTSAARATVAPWQQLDDSDAAPRRWQRALRVLVTIVCVVFLFIGFRAAFRQTPTAPAAQVPVAATYPEGAASGAAARFAVIYASWSQDAAAVRRTAMATVWGGDPAAGWNGRGWQNASAPAVVRISVVDAQRARVTVVMTVTSWSKDTKGRQVKMRTQPMALEVPVSVSKDGIARVSDVPVWVAVPSVAKPVTGQAGETDSALTSQTSQIAAAFFTAYGRDSDLSSLTAPGSTLTGLAGALTLGSVRQWTVYAPKGDTATADAEVIWSTPNGATLTQTYQVTLRRTVSGDASRWQVLALTA